MGQAVQTVLQQNCASPRGGSKATPGILKPPPTQWATLHCRWDPPPTRPWHPFSSSTLKEEEDSQYMKQLTHHQKPPMRSPKKTGAKSPNQKTRLQTKWRPLRSNITSPKGERKRSRNPSHLAPSSALQIYIRRIFARKKRKKAPGQGVFPALSPGNIRNTHTHTPRKRFFPNISPRGGATNPRGPSESAPANLRLFPPRTCPRQTFNLLSLTAAAAFSFFFFFYKHHPAKPCPHRTYLEPEKYERRAGEGRGVCVREPNPRRVRSW